MAAAVPLPDIPSDGSDIELDDQDDSGDSDQDLGEQNHSSELFWGDTLWELLVTETNRYAEQQRAAHPPPQFAPRCIPVNIAIIKPSSGFVWQWVLCVYPTAMITGGKPSRCFVPTSRSTCPVTAST